jgi:hypothetical protein
MMAEAMDRELELVKLQIAAEDCHSEVEINSPIYVTMAVAVLAIAFSIKVDTVTLLMFLGVLLIMFCLAVRTSWRYNDGIRKLNGYVEDIEAGKPLPSLTTLCGVKEKKK